MEVEERMKELQKCITEEERSGDSFAERAEWYYQKRPLLLALLQDLYNDYTILLERCRRMESSNSGRHPPLKLAFSTDQNSQFEQEDSEFGDCTCTQVDSDAESTLSYQQLTPNQQNNNSNNTFGVGVVDGVVEVVVAEVVVKNVEKEILEEQMSEMEQVGDESLRKIELLKKLLEVLESERMVLLTENARLEYKVEALVEENGDLSSEAMFLRRKAGELSRCVLKMREDHRVYMLTRKIEDLQGQIYGLEERNKEFYYQQLLMKKDQQQQQEQEQEPEPEPEKKNKNKSRTGGGGGHCHVALVGCFQVEKMRRSRKGDDSNCQENSNGGGKVRIQKWWERVKRMDVFSMPGCAINQ